MCRAFWFTFWRVNANSSIYIWDFELEAIFVSLYIGIVVIHKFTLLLVTVDNLPAKWSIWDFELVIVITMLSTSAL